MSKCPKPVTRHWLNYLTCGLLGESGNEELVAEWLRHNRDLVLVLG